jgi:hypothetical protein
VKPTFIHFETCEFVFRVTNLGEIEFRSLETEAIVEKAAVKGDSAAKLLAAVFHSPWVTIRSRLCSPPGDQAGGHMRPKLSQFGTVSVLTPGYG